MLKFKLKSLPSHILSEEFFENIVFSTNILKYYFE